MRNYHRKVIRRPCDLQKVRGGIKHGFFYVMHLEIPHKTTQQMLWPLINEIPAQMRKTNKMMGGGRCADHRDRIFVRLPVIFLCQLLLWLLYFKYLKKPGFSV